MAAIIYLESDDEITSAAARIRAAADGPVAIVLPDRSRLATSRINFRLLAREAQTRGRRLSIVAGDAATRALAVSAGLPVFGSVGEFESAREAGPDDGPGTSAAGGAAGSADGGDPGAGTAPGSVAGAGGIIGPPGDDSPTVIVAPRPVGPDTDLPTGGDAGPRTGASVLPTIGRPRRIKVPGLWVAAAVLVGLVVVAGSIGAYVYLPTATVTLTPRVESVGPVRLTVIADPDTGVPDPAAGTVPAERLAFEVQVADTFPATGRRVEETSAAGRVTFSNLNTGGPNQIPAGSIVSTEGGIQFRTAAALMLPPAEIVLGIPIRIEPSTAAVDVTAVRAGPEANVPANAVTVVPPGEDPTLTKIRNDAAMSGGNRTSFTLVSQADVDGALAALADRLPAAFDAILDDPLSTPPEATLFRATKRLGEATPTADAAGFVGQEIASFDLGLMATGTVVAVDVAPISAMADGRLRAEVDGGHRLVADSIEVEVGEGSVEGELVSFPATARASQVRILVADELREAIRGLQIPEARLVLEAYGTAEIEVWPDWVTAIPTLDARLEVEIVDPAPLESTAPGVAAAR